MGFVPPNSQYAQASDLSNTGALPGWFQSLTSTQINAALANASSIMDSKFTARYTMPLLQWSADVVQYCVWIAIYLLIAPRGFNPLNPAEVVYQDNYKMAMKWLDDVANMKANPAQILDSSPQGAGPGETPPPAAPSTVSPTTGTPFAGATWGTQFRR